MMAAVPVSTDGKMQYFANVMLHLFPDIFVGIQGLILLTVTISIQTKTRRYYIKINLEQWR